MLDWLKAILGDAYTEEIDGKVAAELGKGYAPRADLDAALNAKQSLEATVQDRDKQLDGLKKAGNGDELKQQIAQLQEANKQAKSDYDANLKKLTLSSKIDTALLSAKVHDPKEARVHLDESKISLDGDNLIGLNDQVEALKKARSYLFTETAPQNQNPAPPSGGIPTVTDTSKMTDAEYYASAFSKKQ